MGVLRFGRDATFVLVGAVRALDEERAVSPDLTRRRGSVVITATNRRLSGGVAVVTVAALTVMGCARGGGDSENTPGITDDTVTLGTTSPLTGSAAGVGNCAVDGAVAYFEARNAEGGIEFGDGLTRTVEFEVYDDTYDPQQALANFQRMAGNGVLATAFSLGTPTNLAWRDAAIAEGIPQVLVQTGDPLFSDREASPLQLGLIPIYQQEGEAFGEMLAASGEQLRVAILAQNDDFGEGYVEGFTNVIEQHPQIEIVAELSFEATADDVSAQITELAASEADVFFNAMSSLTPLVIGSLQQADAVGWHPRWFLPSTSSSPAALLEPSGVVGSFPAIYSTASALTISDPDVAASPDGAAFLEALEAYTDQDGAPTFPQCVWSWIGAAVLEEAFTRMEEPTRENFMTSLLSITDFEAPLMLPGTVIDTTQDGLPAMSGAVVQRYEAPGYVTVDTYE